MAKIYHLTERPRKITIVYRRKARLKTWPLFFYVDILKERDRIVFRKRETPWLEIKNLPFSFKRPESWEP